MEWQFIYSTQQSSFCFTEQIHLQKCKISELVFTHKFMKDGINNMILIQYIWQNVLEADNSNDGWNI